MLVDDHALVLCGLRYVVKPMQGIRIVGEAKTGEEALVLAEHAKPDVVILDICLPGMNGVSTAIELLSLDPALAIIGMSAYPTAPTIQRLLQLGARGFITKDAVIESVPEAITCALQGSCYLCPVTTEVLHQAATASGMPGVGVLTSREQQVVSLLSEGFTVKDIATRLCLSENTVNTHVKHLKDKLNMHNLAALTRYALTTGLSPFCPNSP